MWAALAGARVAPSGWRRARAMLHFDRTGELKRRFLLTAVERNRNAQLRVRALQEIAAAKDAEAFDLSIDVIGTWAREERREGAKVMFQALAEKRIGRRDQANAWIWRLAEYTREVHEEYAVQRWPETKRLLGPARELQRRRPRAQRAPARARRAQAGPPPAGRAARRRGGAHAGGRGGPARRAHAPGAQAERALARAAAQLPQGQGPPLAAPAQEGGRRGPPGRAGAGAAQTRAGPDEEALDEAPSRPPRSTAPTRPSTASASSVGRRRPAGRRQAGTRGRAHAARAGARTPTRRATRPTPLRSARLRSCRSRCGPGLRGGAAAGECRRGHAHEAAQAAPRSGAASAEAGDAPPDAPTADAPPEAPTARRAARGSDRGRAAEALATDAPPDGQPAEKPKPRRTRKAPAAKKAAADKDDAEARRPIRRRRPPSCVPRAPSAARRQASRGDGGVAAPRRCRAARSSCDPTSATALAGSPAESGAFARVCNTFRGPEVARRTSDVPDHPLASPKTVAKHARLHPKTRTPTTTHAREPPAASLPSMRLSAPRLQLAHEMHLARAQRGPPAARQLDHEPPVAVDPRGAPAPARPRDLVPAQGVAVAVGLPAAPTSSSASARSSAASRRSSMGSRSRRRRGPACRRWRAARAAARRRAGRR